jgi:hypothetical protein
MAEEEGQGHSLGNSVLILEGMDNYHGREFSGQSGPQNLAGNMSVFI